MENQELKEITKEELEAIRHLISGYNLQQRAGKGKEAKQPLLEKLNLICKKYHCWYCIHEGDRGFIKRIQLQAKEEE